MENPLPDLSRLNDNERWFHLGATLGTIRADIDKLVGNGQPGRIKLLEDKVSLHEKYLWLVMGGGIAIGWILHYGMAALSAVKQ